MARGTSLAAYALPRLLIAVPLLLTLLPFVFITFRIPPGAAVLALGGGRPPPPPVIEAARAQLGLDQPPWVQYVSYLKNIFTGNFGTSFGEFYRGQSVWTVMMEKFPATVELTVGAMFVATVLGIVTGVWGGANGDKPIDVAMRLYGTIVWVIPIFWLGLIFQLIFCVLLHLLPPP